MIADKTHASYAELDFDKFWSDMMDKITKHYQLYSLYDERCPCHSDPLDTVVSHQHGHLKPQIVGSGPNRRRCTGTADPWLPPLASSLSCPRLSRLDGPTGPPSHPPRESPPLPPGLPFGFEDTPPLASAAPLPGFVGKPGGPVSGGYLPTVHGDSCEPNRLLISFPTPSRVQRKKGSPNWSGLWRLTSSTTRAASSSPKAGGMGRSPPGPGIQPSFALLSVKPQPSGHRAPGHAKELGRFLMGPALCTACTARFLSASWASSTRDRASLTCIPHHLPSDSPGDFTSEQKQLSPLCRSL
jgi:hypothetical protein